MPNKRKMAKLATRMLISGKMNSNKDVQETMKFIKQKHIEDKEDINFDVIDSFGKSLPTKIKTPKAKKRKTSKPNDELEQSNAKKAKIEKDTSVDKEPKSSNTNALPKKSIYFLLFMASYCILQQSSYHSAFLPLKDFLS